MEEEEEESKEEERQRGGEVLNQRSEEAYPGGNYAARGAPPVRSAP